MRQLTDVLNRSKNLVVNCFLLLPRAKHFDSSVYRARSRPISLYSSRSMCCSRLYIKFTAINSICIHNRLRFFHNSNTSSKKSPMNDRSTTPDHQQVNLDILFYVPNIIGYGRILIACAAFVFYQDPPVFIVLYTLSITLDGFDGYAARKLNQCSKFGAWFDVTIDLFTRGYLWCALFRNGYIIVFLEWLTFLSTHIKGENWKIPEENFPLLVKMVMANGFKTPAGIFAVGSLHILPLWFYGYESRFFTQTLGLPMWLQLSGIVFLTVGRTVCAAVELFYCKEYVKDLLRHR